MMPEPEEDDGGRVPGGCLPIVVACLLMDAAVVLAAVQLARMLIGG